MIKAVIFDMDGVISDTLNFHSEAETKTLSKYGIKMTPQQIVREFNAVPDPVMFQEIFSRFKVKASINQVIKEKYELMRKLAKNNILPIPGSVAFIKLLKESDFTLGVASSSPREFINLVIESLNIKEDFEATTSTDEVKRGKPNPDIFLLTAKKLDVHPRNCLIIEDAPRGIEAANNALMKSVAITTTHKREELLKAGKIIKSFEELSVNYIRNL